MLLIFVVLSDVDLSSLEIFFPTPVLHRDPFTKSYEHIEWSICSLVAAENNAAEKNTGKAEGVEICCYILQISQTFFQHNAIIF